MIDCGEKRLLDAIILNAVEDLNIKLENTKDRCVRNRLNIKKDRARTWLESKKNSFGSFEWYCDLVDYDAEAIRKRVLYRRADEEGIQLDK